jgi:hypothetical protein
MASATAKARKEALTRNKKFDNNRSTEQKTKNLKKTILNYNNQIHVINNDTIKTQGYITDYEAIIARRTKLYNAKRKEYLASGGFISESENNDLLDNPSYGIGRNSNDGTASYETAIVKWKKDIKTNEEKIASYQEKITELQNTLLGKKPTPKPKNSDTSSGTNPVTDQGTTNFSKDYKYNAPMVRSAYFTSSKGVAQSLVGVTNDGNFVDQGNYQDALRAWTGTTGGRGTIQMDRKFVNALAKSQENQVTPLDPQMYGFKFLYNPKEIAMARGVMDKMDPEYIASGTDPFNVISAGLMSATIQVTILLNRIGDFSFINEYGYNSGFGTTDTSPDAVLQRIQQTGISAVNNPYPENVSTDEVMEIYKKGTMYDVEYLLRTLNGPHATFVSKLNGKTADRGWLRPSIVEIHLGAGMRYRVRVAQLSVTHSVFNSRMVPILSSVQLTLGRFNDGPETNGATSANPYGNRGGRYVGSTFVPNP